MAGNEPERATAMDALMKLSREAQVVLAGSLVYVILSFFAWQQAGGFSANEWDGLGVFAALIAVVLLVWELGRALDAKIEVGSLGAATVSFVLALLLLYLTIAMIIASSYLHWPAWVGLVVSIVVAGAAYLRAQNEGIALPRVAMPAGVTRTGTTTSAAPPPPAADDMGAAAPPPPAPEPADDMGAAPPPPPAAPPPPAPEPADDIGGAPPPPAPEPADETGAERPEA